MRSQSAALARLYQAKGLDGVKNHPQWGGEHGQRPLTTEELVRLSTLLEAEAMPGMEVGSGWTVKAIRDLIAERFGISYSRRGVRKLLRAINWSYQRGDKLSIKRSAEEQARFELETAEVLAEFARSRAQMTPLHRVLSDRPLPRLNSIVHRHDQWHLERE